MMDQSPITYTDPDEKESNLKPFDVTEPIMFTEQNEQSNENYLTMTNFKAPETIEI